MEPIDNGVKAAFPVPRYLAETAAREPGVRDWIKGLPGIVADLARRWSLSVGEPFQPGGQCSWVAPATGLTGTPLVLKVGFRFAGGEERDEAAGLRIWDGNGTVRLHAACDDASAYALLMERCVPGTPLGQVLSEPEQDVVVAGLLRRLWAREHLAYPFRPLARMCAAWADEFEAEYAAAGPAHRIDPGLARAGIALFRSLSGTADGQCCCAPTCTPTTSWPHGGSRGWSSIPSRMRAIPPTTSCSTCSTARTGWPPTRPGWLTGWPG